MSPLHNSAGQQELRRLRETHQDTNGQEESGKANPKITALQVELAHMDGEIENPVDSLNGANNVLLSYVNVRIAKQDERKQELVKQIAD